MDNYVLLLYLTQSQVSIPGANMIVNAGRAAPRRTNNCCTQSCHAPCTHMQFQDSGYILPDSECSDQRTTVIVARNHLAWTSMSCYCITISGINPNESTGHFWRELAEWSADHGCLEKESGSQPEVLPLPWETKFGLCCWWVSGDRSSWTKIPFTVKCFRLKWFA